MQSLIKILLLSFLILFLFGLVPFSPVLISQNFTHQCRIKTLDELQILSESGVLIYQPTSHEQNSVMNFVQTVQLPLHPQTLQISPDGMYIAGEDIHDNVSNLQTVTVLNRSFERVYEGAVSPYNILNIQWLGNNRLLSFIQIPAGTGSEVAYHVIDPFNREYTYVQPESTSRFYLQNSQPIPIGGYQFTYDGRYLFWDNAPIYDFVMDSPLIVQNLRGGIPSLNSHKLISVDYSTYLSDGIYLVYIYDFDTDTLTQPVTFTPETTISGDYENSWSPDENLWAYTLDYSNDDLDSFRRIELLEVETGQIRQTCFGLTYELRGETGNQTIQILSSPDFAWSRDGRYLALQGVIEGQDMDESLGVYIYDTQTEEIYLVHQGRADIIGWMVYPQDE